MAVHRPRIECMSGGSSTQRVARLIATGIRDLIPKRFASGGMMRPRLCVSRMGISRCA